MRNINSSYHQPGSVIRRKAEGTGSGKMQRDRQKLSTKAYPVICLVEVLGNTIIVLKQAVQ